MKTYEEMAQSVLERAKIHKAIRRRQIITVTSVLCALAIVIGIGLWMIPGQPDTLQDTSVTEPADATIPNAEPRITMLFNDGTDTTAFGKGVKMPCHSEIWLKDVRDLPQEEKEAIAHAEKDRAQALVDSYTDLQGWNYDQHDGDEMIVTSVVVGHIIVGIEDYTQVESLYLTVNGAVNMMYIPHEEEFEKTNDWWNHQYPRQRIYEMTHDLIPDYYYEPYGGIELSWMVSSELCHELAEGNMKLSDAQETIDITVTFTDGTVEHHPIDLIFNDDGSVYYLYRGMDAAV